MNVHDVLDFLLPNLGDPIQVAFMVILSAMMLATVTSAHKYACPASWEQKWNRGTPNDDSDDLDIEHGSVTDLWHAVATGPEKLAEVMPGLLLVVGLLGTFLGLGLALNHASNILGRADAMSASGAAGSMQDLLGLLQGLGTKFKTSTWGISGFVLLRIWSEFTRFEEKRLTWVISKVKNELDKRQKITLENEQSKQRLLFDQMGIMAEKMIAGLTEQVSTILAQNSVHHENSLDTWRTSLAELAKESANGCSVVVNTINQQSKIFHGDLMQLHQATSAANQVMMTGMTEHVNTVLAENSAHHERLIDAWGSSMQVFSKESANAKDVVVNAINQQSKILHTDLIELNQATQSTHQAMTQFTSSTQSIVENMSDAAERMADGADNVGSAASELVVAIDAFKSQFTDVLDNVRKDLGTAIQNMSQQASSTLERGSLQLGDATREISVALGQLSGDVKGTMNEVKGSINQALTIQQNASEEFILSSQTLNENIVATTGMVDKLGKPIEAGLTAISESNRKTEFSIKKMDAAFSKLEAIIEYLDQLPNAMSPLNNLENVIKNIDSLASEVGSLCQRLEPIKYLHSDTKEIVDKIDSLSVTLEFTRSIIQEIQYLRSDSKECSSKMNTLSFIPEISESVLQEIQGLRKDIMNAFSVFETETVAG